MTQFKGRVVIFLFKKKKKKKKGKLHLLNIEIVCWRENNIKRHLNPSSTVYSTSTVGSRGVEGKCVDFDFFFLFYWLIQKKIYWLIQKKMNFCELGFCIFFFFW